MKKRVTFEVDDRVLFDMMHSMRGDCSLLGLRIASSMLSPPSTAELIGMEYYGVSYVGTEPISDPAPKLEDAP